MKDFVPRTEVRQVTVGIIGLGYVGIPLAISVSEVGFKVVGFDILEKRIEQMSNRGSPIGHISCDAIGRMRADGFEATSDFLHTAECDALIICVPTPLNSHREPDLGFVEGTMRTIAP